MFDLGTLGGRNSEASDINESGDIVGWSDTASGGTHAFVYRDGKMLDLGTLGGANSYASAVNSAGDIVGSSGTPSGAVHAFLYKNGVMLDLGTLGGLNSEASDINDSGVVIGSSETTKELWPGGCCGSDAFIYRNGAMVGYGCGSQKCSASSINEAGDIVGSASDGYFPTAVRIFYHGWSSRGWVFDPTLSFPVTAAGVINDAGQIIVSADMDWPHASSPHRTAELLLDPVR
jgi:probable HAF family extracellular repeat protein